MSVENGNEIKTYNPLDEDQKKQIQRYSREGYDGVQISKKTGIPKSTVYRVLNNDSVIEANQWFNELATKQFIKEYWDTIKQLDDLKAQSSDGLAKLESDYTIRKDKIMEVFDTVPDDRAGTKAMLLQALNTLDSNYHGEKQSYIKTIADLTNKRGSMLHKGPMAYAIDQVLKKHTGEPPVQIKSMQALEDVGKVNE